MQQPKAAGPFILAGDIGGTKTDLAVFSSTRGVRAPLAQATFVSREFPNLEALVREFLSGVEFEVDQAGLGVAGPVVRGKATITHLPWVLDEGKTVRACQLRAGVLRHGIPEYRRLF